MRLLTLILVMFIYWLLLSGHYTTWLIVSGVLCSFLVLLAGLRLGYADEEGHPIGQLARGLIYWPWLVKEIILSALDVTKLILHPSLPISPALVRIKASQKSAMGLTTYANSITLTPGTISSRVSSHDHEITVHAISHSSAMGLADGKMDGHVTWFEGNKS